METVIILVVAAGLSAAVVWWASTPPGTPTLPRRRPAPLDTGFRPTLRGSFQPTGPEPGRTPVAAPDDGFLVLQQTTVDDRPPRILSVLRIAVTIAFVAVLGVLAVAFLAFLVKLQLDKYLGG